MESPTEDYKIQSFDQDTQMLLKTALKGQHVSTSALAATTLSQVHSYVAKIFHNSMFITLMILVYTVFSLCFSDPGSVNLEKVSNVIIDHSLKDQMFSKEAGRICYTIVQVKALSVFIK